MRVETRINDGRGLYPELIRVRGPIGLDKRLRRAAKAEQITVSEFVRRAVARRLLEVEAGTTA